MENKIGRLILKNYIFLILNILFFVPSLHAQTNWSQLGSGLSIADRVQDITYNPNTGEYYIVTDFNGVSSDVYKLSNNVWTNIASVGNSNGSFANIEYYNGSIYVGCVEMVTLSGTTINSLARYDGSNWHSVGTGLTRLQVNSQVRDMRVWKGMLILTGQFDHANGVSAINVAAIIDTTLGAAPFSTSQMNLGNEIPNRIGEYNGNLILGIEPNNLNIFSVDSSTYSVSNIGSFNFIGEINSFDQFNGELYMVGQFSVLGTNSIIKWNGINWSSVNGPNLNPYAISVNNLNNKLYVCHGTDIWEDYSSSPVLITTSNQLQQNIQPRSKKINDCLYIFGNFDMFDSVPAICIVKSCESTLPVSNFISNDTSFCSGTCINFSNQSTLDSTWQWFFPGGNPASSNMQTPPQICYSTPGTYNVTLITSNAFGSDTLTLPNYITVNTTPTAQASSNSPICAGENLNLVANGGTTYTWIGPNGFTSTQQNPIIPNTILVNSGLYSVIVANGAGCTDTALFNVSINPNVQAVANSNSPICAGENITLTASSGASYQWTGPNGFTSSQQNPIIVNSTLANSGSYSVIVSNIYGCSDTASVLINVLSNTPITANSNGPLCQGQTLNLTASNGSAYLWTGPNGFSSTLQNPSINNIAVSNSGVYSVVVTNNNGCTDSSSVTVVVNPNTPITASSNSPVCEGQNLVMNASAGLTYSWTGPNGFISSLQNPTINNITSNASGVYTVSVTNACGTGSSNFNVQVSQRPTASITVTSVVICEGDTLSLNATGGGTYYWYGPNSFSSNSQSPSVNNFTSADAGQYNVIVTNMDNCSDTTSINISLNQSTCFFIPSVFTPNNDGFNDTWFIEGMWQYPNCVVKVFNRWGQKLFESKGYSTPWDGTAEGNECPVADYYFIIDLQNNTRVLTGTITIKR
jgi:gliding motility-associated-like protein